ncbi:hypothetical protein RJ641_024525 [Dillenia turbinata]|uniref:Integrator complex subunit 4/Protein SIEL C-terminal Ig-like domain-containing protein n=1 Tax=Dillenia turbinata TaxID=194707 RepID=A0AAN8WBE3_9MAGN
MATPSQTLNRKAFSPMEPDLEQQIWGKCLLELTNSPNLDCKSPYFQTLASTRTLIVNPSTSDSMICLIFETLILSFRQNRNSPRLRHVIKLLSDLAFHHPSLSSQIFEAIRSLAFESVEDTRLVADCLSAIVNISEFCEIDGDFVVSLCFRESVSVRKWILSNAEKFQIRPYLMVTILLGFTKDPYPLVRKVALEGLVKMKDSVTVDDNGRGTIEGCFRRAVELLSDMEDFVRMSAVSVVSELGQVLVESTDDTTRRDFSDAVFLQLSSMVRDMAMEVRVVAFNSLGLSKIVSEDILLQTLSKKVLEIKRDDNSHEFIAKHIKKLSSSAAGAFIHGVEDEFYEVRQSACRALGMLSVLSVHFAGKAIDLLMDVLNDDSIVVRSQALESLYCLVSCDCLKVEETHMHMFLATLLDNSTSIRSATRKVLKFIKLHDKSMFESCVEGLLENLERYPQDEADVLSALFNVGRSHGTFAISLIEAFFEELEPSSRGKLDFDSTRVAALLMLAISSPFSHEPCVSAIPPRLFSYAVTLLGRLSCALTDVMDQDTLLAFLCHCSRSRVCSVSMFQTNEKEQLLLISEEATQISSSGENGLSGMPDIKRSKMELQKMQHPRQVAIPASTTSCSTSIRGREVVSNTLKLILENIKDFWPLMHSGHVAEVLKTLRVYKEELAMLISDFPGCNGELRFVLQYLRVVKLLAKSWKHFLSVRKVQSCAKGELGILLKKLDGSVIELRYRFIGLNKEEELHVLELVLVTDLLKLCSANLCSLQSVKKLSTTLKLVQSIYRGESIQPSHFVLELEKLFGERSSPVDDVSYNNSLFKKLLGYFSFKQFALSGRLEHIKAELSVPGNDPESPLPFISGLPVSIKLDMTLYNISKEKRLWLSMFSDEVSNQFLFLDLNNVEFCDEVAKISYIAPFYRTPKVDSFVLSVCIGMECSYREVESVRGFGGPKRELAFLCQETKIYLQMAKHGPYEIHF